MALFDSPAVRVRAVCLLLFLGTLLLFWRGVGFGFSNYDDPSYVTNNPHVQAGLSWKGVGWAFTGRADYWHPLTWLSHMTDWQFYGDQARWHHLTSVIWHGLNAVLVFLVLRRLTGFFWTSAFGAALFAWHPLRVESVVWIAERKDVMSGFFFLLTILAYVSYVENRRKGRVLADGSRAHRSGASAPSRVGGRAGAVPPPPSPAAITTGTGLAPRAAWWYGLTLAAFVGGIMSKPMLVTLPGVLLLLDFWPLRRGATVTIPCPGNGELAALGTMRTWAWLLLEKAPFFLVSIVVSIVTVVMQRNFPGFKLVIPFGDRLANAIVSVIRYLGKFFWPFDLTVCYSHPGHWPAATVCTAAALVVVVTGVAWWQRRTRPWLWVGWLWFIGMLLPVSGLVQAGFQAMADRYTYLPMLGVQLALLCTWSAGPARFVSRWINFALAAFVLIGCAARTWSQEATWRDPNTLFEHALAVTVDNYVGHFFLGTTLFYEGRVDEARVQISRAIAINPGYAPALELLGEIGAKQGRTAEAYENYHRALELDPRDAQTDYAFGLFLLQQEQPADAAGHFASALRNNPEFPAAYMGLAQAEIMLGHPQAAIHNYEEALARNPDDTMAHHNFAVLLVAQGQVAKAMEQFEKSLQLSPNVGEFQCDYADLLRAVGRWPEACDHFRQAITLQPKNSAAHFGLGLTLEQMDRTGEALASFVTATELRPDFAAAHCRIGTILLSRRDAAGAGVHFRTAAERQPDFGLAHLGLGLVAAQLGRPSEAIADFQRALALDPNNAAIHNAWGDTLARSGQLEEAVSHYRQALRLHPDDAAAHARLGFALYLTAHRAEAVTHWEEALRLDPSLPGLRERLERARGEMAADPAK